MPFTTKDRSCQVCAGMGDKCEEAKLKYLACKLGKQEMHNMLSSSVALQVSKVSAAAPPSCMCAVGPELIFLGSCAGDSLLLRALPEQQAKAEVWL